MSLDPAKIEEEELSKLYAVSEAGDEYGDGDGVGGGGGRFDDEVEEGENEGNEGDTSNSNDTTNMGHPDNGTPTTAPAPTPQMAESTTHYIFGPQREVPKNIIDTLQEWHTANPYQKPPCFFPDQPLKKWRYRVFDRNGNELSLSVFCVSQPIPYRFTFLSGHGDARLVTCRKSSPRKILLFGWDVRNKFDSKPCAVQLSEASTSKSLFQEKLFCDFQEFFDSLVGGVPNAGNKDGVEKGGNEGNDTSNSTGSTNIERSHEDTTATTLAPAFQTAPQTAPQTAKSIAKTMIAGCAIAKHIFGPIRVPEHIVNTITEWHKAHPEERPPFIHIDKPYPRGRWKVFDRNGNQLLLSMFSVYHPIAYYFTFVLDHHGASKLVATERLSPWQYLLFGWDLKNGFESEPCGVWLIKRDVKDLVFDEGCFNNFTKGSNGKTKYADLTGAGNGAPTTTDQNVSRKTRTTRSTGTAGNDMSTTTDQNAARADRARRRSERFSRVRGGESTNATTHSAQRRDNNPDDDAGPDPVCSPSGSASEEVQACPTKRRRKNSVAPPASPTPPPPESPAPASTPAPAPASVSAPTPPTLPAPPTSTPTSTNPNKVALALISSDVICHLPIDECTSSRYLFERARDFLSTLGQELAAKFLICQVPSEGKRRMLYEGDETSFKWLLNDVESLQRAAGEALVVEVKHPDWWVSSTPS